MKITDTIAIVTGASSGIGRATALELARKGAQVALAARNLAALRQLAGEIQALGREVLVVPTDVTRRNQVECLVQETSTKWGRVDILISNAGQYLRSPIAGLSISLLEQSMAVNFYGGVYAALAVLPHMLSRGKGHIVLISTMDAKKGLPPDAPYVAAKFALSGFGEVLRQELYRTGVDVTTVFPGRVDTPMIQSLRVPWTSAKISAEAVAGAIVKGIERRRAEIILPPQAKLLHLANLVSPRLGDWAVRFLHLQGWDAST